MRNALVLIGFAGFLQLASSVSATDNLPERIRRVEDGLLLPVVIKAQSPIPMTLEERMAHYKTPGVSIAVVDEGRIAWARGYGVRVAGGSDPVTPETPFQAGSISKPVTAAAALILVDHGQLWLDQPVNARLTSWKIPENDFTRERAVTLRHILTHTSGLTNHAVGAYGAGTQLPSLPDILDGKPPATSQPIRVDYLPGSRWRYSGGGFTVLQQLLIDVRAEQFPELMRQSVLHPVGMLHSTFQQPIRDSLTANAAIGHTADGTPLDGNWRLFPEMAAAGLWSTPSDLSRFFIEIQKATLGEANTILSQPLAEAMVSRQFEDWGLGFAVTGHGSAERFHHGGDTEGYKCDMVAFRRRGCGAVIMTNGERGERLTTEILRSIAREYRWPDFAPKEKSVVALDASVMAAYVGKYKLEINEASVIFSIEDDQFVMEVVQPGGRSKVKLYPESDTTFFRLEADQEVVFGKNAGGQVDHVIIQQGDEAYRANRD